MATSDSSHSHAHDDHEHGLAHVASVKILVGTGATLLVLTVITVLATRVDFGSQMNLLIAMLIATVKATLVAMYFMHLRFDKPFHTVVIVSGILFALLFVGFAFMDGNQYQRDVCVTRGADCGLWHDAIGDWNSQKAGVNDNLMDSRGMAQPDKAE